MLKFERPDEALPSARQFWRALDRHSLTNGLTAWLMACTGPFVVMLGVGVDGGLTQQQIDSWVLAGFGLGGLLSIAMSYCYRIPLGIGWSIPGVVILGGSLGHLSLEECVGAFFICAALITVLGLTGWVDRVARYLPLSVVMAMVAGVFLPFVLKIVSAFPADWRVATVTVLAFVGTSAFKPVARIVPPILAAIVAGAFTLALTGQLPAGGLPSVQLTAPVFYMPEFTWQATVELVIPLAITVVGIHNLQSFAITEANGYPPPRNTITTLCGVSSFAFGLLGSVPTVGTGPANGILNLSGEKERRYAGGVVFGTLMLLFGLFAPFTTAIALTLPMAFMGLVGGLAMFEVLRGSFLSAFNGRLSAGALTTFIITVADQPIANIGAPFWAIVFGLAVSWLFERRELA